MRPADGERRAIVGYSAQYALAAKLIYEALIDSDLQWIRLADPEAGRVDDVQIARPGRLDAYQVKWSEFERRITFAELISESGSAERRAPSPIAQLADGWTRLAGIHPDREVRVHFLTRSSPSSDDKIQGAPEGPAHLQRFLRDAFAYRSTLGQGRSPTLAWTEAFEAMRRETKLSVDDFARFIPSAQLDLGYRLEDGDDTARRQADLDRLARFLLNAVGQGGVATHWTRETLLAELGWRDRLDLRFRHEFPVDERLYRPVRATVAELEGALSRFQGGYLALLGPPGSGKSTTLTQMLRYRPGVRTIRYYAFVRDDLSPGRGEAEAFLQDLTVALREAGVEPLRASGAIPSGRGELQELLGALLAALRADWKERGVQTIILVDGLDHIDREQRPAVPLFDVLPSPEQVPEGVIFVLGSQPVGLNNVAERIRGQLAEDGRTMTMHRLERADVRTMCDEALGPERLAPDQLDAFLTLTEGHPLSVSYLLKRLGEVEDHDALQAILEATNPYDGDIETDYGLYWADVREDPEVCALLGALCRLRTGIELPLLLRLSSETVVQRLLSRAQHYFHRETAQRWTFFHNSFRQFLIRVTGLNLFGQRDPGRHRDFHLRLANLAGEADAQSPFGWERIHHLAEAGDHAEILTTFTQERFRQQFLALRPISEILDDLTECLRAAKALDDRDAFVRAVLIEHELRARDEALEDSDLLSLLVGVADRDELPEVAFHGAALRLDDAAALKLAGACFEAGDEALARRLFDAAEPHAFLTGARAATTKSEHEVLRAWARTAWRFRSMETVLLLLGQVRRGRDRPDLPSYLDESAEAPVDTLAGDLAEILAQTLRRRDDAERLAAVAAWLAARDDERSRLTLQRLDYGQAFDAAHGRGDREAGRQALDRASLAWPPQAGDVATMASLADLHHRLGSDPTRIEAYLHAIDAPPTRELDLDREDRTLRAFEPLIDYASLMAALERPLDPVQAVPPASREGRTGGMLLQRMLVLLANVVGAADRGERLSPDMLVARLRPATRLFARDWNETSDWTDWHSARSKAGAYFEALLEAAAAHGREALVAMLEALREDWRHPRLGPLWTPSWRLAVILGAEALDPDRDRTTAWIDELDQSVDLDTELSTRIGEERELARAWLRLGERQRARRVMARMVGATFGVYHDKDDQLARWSAWAVAAADLDPSIDLDGVVPPLLRGAAMAHREHRGADRTRPVFLLLRLAFARDPAWGLDLAKWLETEKASSRDAIAEGIVAGAIDAARTPGDVVLALDAAARLLVPFGRDAPKDLARALGAACGQQAGQDTVRAAFDRLVRAIKIKAPVEDRGDWLSRLARGLEASGARAAEWGLAPEPPQAPRDGEIPAGLSLADGGFFPQSRLTDEPVGPMGFIELLGRTEKIERLAWQSVLDANLSGATSQQLRTAHAAVNRLESSAAHEVWFVEAFARAGEKIEAERAAKRVHEASKPTGWASYYDGGTRILAARAAIAARGETARAEAFQWLVEDYLTEFRYPRDLLTVFDPILDVLYATPPAARLWPEAREHLLQLIDVSPGGLPDLPARGARETMEASQALMAWVGEALMSPVGEIEGEARSLLIDLVRDGVEPEKVRGLIIQLLESPDDARQRAGLNVLTCVEPLAPGLAGSLAPRLATLGASPSMIIRDLVDPLLEAAGMPAPDRPTRPLPAFYRLYLPPAAMPKVSLFGELGLGETLPDTTDATELTKVFRPVLAMLARFSGFGVDLLARRLANLMLDQAPRESWDQAAEEAIKSWLLAADLVIPYRRPRINVGQLALGRLVAELFDAGKAPWPVLALQPWLANVDPGLEGLDPVERPAWLPMPEGRSMREKGLGSDWPNDLDAALDGPSEAPDGGLILAEYTCFVRIDHERPTQERAVFVGPDNVWTGEETPEFGHIPGETRFTAAAYPDLEGFEAFDPVFVLRGGGRFRPTFLALSPDLAAEVGWRPSSQGLFAWEDQAGRLMAHTLWWRDGNLVVENLYSYESVAGEGWLVVTTREGRRAMEGLLEVSSRYVVASREIRQRRGRPLVNVGRAQQRLEPDAPVQRI